MIRVALDAKQKKITKKNSEKNSKKKFKKKLKKGMEIEGAFIFIIIQVEQRAVHKGQAAEPSETQWRTTTNPAMTWR